VIIKPWLENQAHSEARGFSENFSIYSSQTTHISFLLLYDKISGLKQYLLLIRLQFCRSEFQGDKSGFSAQGATRLTFR
jgi:hypothetical protein